jgi:Leucine-rich repeat (LRR) protein
MRAILLLLLIASTAFAAPVPKEQAKEVSEKTIQAWKDAGAEVRWVTIEGLWSDKPTAGCRVGFRFHGWHEGLFEKLPAPEGPFLLDVSFPWPDEKEKKIKREMSNCDLKELVQFENIVALDLFGSDITDEGAEHICKLKKLEQLSLRCSRMTEKGLKELAKLEELTRLSLSQMTVNEEMWKEVAGFKKVKKFHLSFNKIEVTDTGIKSIAKLEKLVDLQFFEVSIDDNAAKELAALKNLKEVDFLNTKVTKEGAEALQKALPKCKVTARTEDLKLPPPPVPMLCLPNPDPR